MERDIRLDALRGLVLAWMTLNHLGGPLQAYSFQTLGFVSSAEGFVFISGIVAGMVYGRIGLNQGADRSEKTCIPPIFRYLLVSHGCLYRGHDPWKYP